MSDQLTTIVFDIGSVLIRWDMRNLYRKVFDDSARMEWFLANICTHDFNIEQDRGRPFAEAVADLSRKHPEWKAEIELYDSRWTEMLDGTISGTVDILGELQQKNWPTYAITNFSREKFDVSRKLFPFLDTFRGTVVSADERLVKPDPEIFEVFLQRYNLRGQECVFIDDSLPNVETAKHLGFHALHFTGPEQFRRDLEAAGIR